MTSRKIDQILLALGVVLICISSYQLFLTRLDGSNEGLSLGSLERTEAVVKIKNAIALDWRDAYTGSDVLEQQLIYTDDNSSAEVKFLQGHKVTISENSLVRIASLGQSGGVDVERGIIRAKIEGNKPLIIEVNGSELKLTGENADVQISLQDNKGEIGVLSGEVAVEKNGNIENLDKSSALQIDEDALLKHQIAFTLLEPQPSQTFYTVSESERITFKWDPKSSAKVKISSHPAFKKVISHQGEGSTTVDLTPGSYYWKVEDAKGASLIGSFNVVKEMAPEVLRPLQGETIKLAREKNISPQAFLQWKGIQGQQYLVEWTDKESHNQTLRATGLLIPLTESGTLKWRVKLASMERKLAVWSEWQNVEVTLVDPPGIPVNLLPEELELQSYSKEEFDVELSWKAQSQVELEVLGPKNDRQIKVLDTTSHVLKVSEPGPYKWRLRGKDEFARISDWSEWKHFNLEDLSLELSAEGVQRIQLKKPDQSVTFNWKAASGTNSVFELSESQEFSEVIVKKEVEGDEVKVVVPKTGNFYWRSRQYNSDGTFSISEPRKVIIEPAPAPSKPEKLPHLEVPLEWKETSHPSRWWSFFISEAFADEFKGVAIIQLPPNENAKNFVIRIFKDENGSELLIEKTIEAPVFEWENAKAGNYYWQYAVIDYWGRQSPFSDLSSLAVTGLEPILPEKPKLLSPIRAMEVEEKNLEIKWTSSERNKNYRLEISRSPDFEKILIQKATKDHKLELGDSNLSAGLHYWRVTALNDSKKEVTSNTGRFTVTPPIEKITIVDRPEAWVKKYSKRISFSWAPSSDTYEFEGENKKGEIDGNALNSFEARGLYFADKFIISADLLRQSGKVFKSESYLFQRLLISTTWKKKNGNHLWGPGLSVGSISGFAYEIKNDVVTSSAVSGLVYGPYLQGFYALSSLWELQGKVSYMLGAIPHMEFMGEFSRQMKNYYLIFGAGYSMRDYSKGEGTQTSFRLNLGIGKEF